jgi:plasmid stability protein
MKMLFVKEIPDELFRAVKSQAALDGISMREMVLRLLTAYVQQSRKKYTPAEREPESRASEIG